MSLKNEARKGRKINKTIDILATCFVRVDEAEMQVVK